MQVLEAPTIHLQQTTSYYCGAACSQMLLKRVNIDATQDHIYEVIRSNNLEPDAFYSDPMGITGLLNSKDLDPFQSGDIIIVDGAKQEELADIIFDNLFDNNIPCVCLVNNGNHWVVCHKVIYTFGASRETNMLGVFLLDPAPSSPPEIYVPIDQFLTEVLSPNAFGVKWKGKRVFLAGTKSIKRSAAVSVVSQVPGMGGGGGPDPAVVIANLRRVGVAKAKQQLGGGARPLQVLDLSDNTEYYIVTVDAREDAIFQNFVHSAVSIDGRVLELTIDRNQTFFATDSLVGEAIWTQLQSKEYQIDPKLYWKKHSILRNRFTVARRATKDRHEIWILPSGEIVTTLDAGARGGR